MFHTHIQDRQCTYNVTLGGVRKTTVAVEKKLVHYSERLFVAFGIQHAMHICHVFIYGLSNSTVFPHTIS